MYVAMKEDNAGDYHDDIPVLRARARLLRVAPQVRAQPIGARLGQIHCFDPFP